MKIDPVKYILEKQSFKDKNFYFVSGNEITLMQKIRDEIIQKYQSDQKTIIEHVKNISETSNNNNLFGEKKLSIVSDLKEIDEKKINELIDDNFIFVFFSENSPKTNQIKRFFLNRGDSYVFDCYELTKNDKSAFLKFYFQEEGLSLSNEIFWCLEEMLDNRYGFFKSDLDKIKSLEERLVSVNNIKKLLSQNDHVVDKIFFEIFKKNHQIVELYNLKVNDAHHVNALFLSFKKYCEIIIQNRDLSTFQKNIPSYLFKEKKVFIEIYKKLNFEKISRTIKLFNKTEELLRKQPTVSLIVGLRFLLSFKKIITS